MIAARMVRTLAPLCFFLVAAPLAAQTTADFSDFYPTRQSFVPYRDLFFTETDMAFSNCTNPPIGPYDMVGGCGGGPFGDGDYMWWRVPAPSSYVGFLQPVNVFQIDLAATWTWDAPLGETTPALRLSAAGWDEQANIWGIRYVDFFTVGQQWTTFDLDWHNIYAIQIDAGDNDSVYPLHRITYGVDNVVYSPTPEPEAVLLVGLGLLGVSLAYWRRRAALKG